MTRKRWVAAIAALAMIVGGACAGSASEDAAKEGAPAVTTSVATVAAQARATATVSPTVTAPDFKRMEKYLPTDDELPDRVAYAAKFDLSNEKAANDAAELKAFQDAGRLTGIQAVFSVEAGARTVQFGISYYNNTDEPKKLLRRSGDPANLTGPNRFEVAGLGDEYIAQRGQVGSGEAAVNIVNIAWVRGPFFIGLADIGGPPDKPVDITVQMARLIDQKLVANPTP